MSVLAGNFGGKKIDKTMRGTDYFLEIIQNIPDGIVIVNHGLITLMNKAACRIFNAQDVINHSLEEVIGNNNEEFLKQMNLMSDAPSSAPVSVN